MKYVRRKKLYHFITLSLTHFHCSLLSDLCSLNKKRAGGAFLIPVVLLSDPDFPVSTGPLPT